MAAPNLIFVRRNATSIIMGFDVPLSLSSGTWDDGFSISVNGGSPPLLTAGYGATGTSSIVVTAGLTFATADVVTVAYNDGTGHVQSVSTSTALASFGDTVAQFEPGLGYPLSTVTLNSIAVANQVATPSLFVRVNSVDQRIIDGQSPIYIEIGGTFASTVVIASKQVVLKDGLTISQAFSVPGNLILATQAAFEWQETVTDRINSALSTARVIDKQLTQTIADIRGV